MTPAQKVLQIATNTVNSISSIAGADVSYVTNVVTAMGLNPSVDGFVAAYMQLCARATPGALATARSMSLQAATP